MKRARSRFLFVTCERPPWWRLPKDRVVPPEWFTKKFLLDSGFKDFEINKLVSEGHLKETVIRGGRGWSQWGCYIYHLGSASGTDRLRDILKKEVADKVESRLVRDPEPLPE